MANNFPNLRPSFSADFVNGIYVDPRITFTRAGGRTFFGREMVKAEENLLIHSADLTQAAYTKSFVTAPDANTIVETTANDVHTVAQSISAVSGQTYTQSVTLAKGVLATAPDFMQLTFGSTAFGATQFAVVNVLTGAVISTAGGATCTSVADPLTVGGWRFSYTATATSTATASALGVVFCNNVSASARVPAYVGSTTSDCKVYRMQCENRGAATAYTPTTTQPITRYQRQLKTAAANEWPREFDPVTGECLGRSVWESRTNLVLRSEEFDNAAWTKDAVSISANQIIAPDGTLGADKLVEDTNNVPHFVYSAASITLTGGVVYTLTWYLKAAERTTATIGSGSSRLLVNTTVDLSAGTITSSAASSSSIQNIGNGWYRVRATQTCGSTGGIQPLVYLQTTAAYTGDGTSGIYIWGAQLEAGAFATPYIPTVASQITRLADSAVMTGVNFSSWFNPEQGCLFMQSAPAVLDAGNGVTISDNTANNRIRLGSSTTEQGTVTVSGTAQAALDGGTPVLNTLQSVAMSYKFNDFALSLNGGAVATDTTGTVPVVTQLAFATNEYIRRFTYYPQSGTAANLQALAR
jgi:hypothetical protein